MDCPIAVVVNVWPHQPEQKIGATYLGALTNTFRRREGNTNPSWVTFTIAKNNEPASFVLWANKYWKPFVWWIWSSIELNDTTYCKCCNLIQLIIEVKMGEVIFLWSIVTYTLNILLNLFILQFYLHYCGQLNFGNDILVL